jgi:hypothetical protein
VQIANQTGGTLFYKTSTQISWSNVGLNYYSNTSANQYWQVSLNTAAFGSNGVVQYYFLLTFDGSNGVTNTCLYGNNSGSLTTGSTNVAPPARFHSPLRTMFPPRRS